MEYYYMFVVFIFGIVLGSFYNVVGYRLPRGQSLLFPSSHCTNCNHKLGITELIPVFSFLLQKGRCKKCKNKISWFYPIFEFTTGILFLISYLIFGFNIQFFIAITFISTLLIIIISDYQTMIIPDELIIFSSVLLIIELYIKNGLHGVIFNILTGIIMFIIMYLLKKLGDFLFKKESMGGGDIKLMFIFGLIFDLPVACISICLAAFIALPTIVLLLPKLKDKEIPFGPFLAISAIILLLFKVDTGLIVDLLTI